MSEAYAAAPQPSYRLVPSQFPPVGLFDTVTTPADLSAVMELAGWTNDRLVEHRLGRLPEAQRVYGRPNASVVMAAFLHAAPGGMRFNGPDLGAWYASAALTTAATEVAHHLRREALARGRAGARRIYRAYTATLLGSHLDLRGQREARPDLYDPQSYVASQVFGEAVRAASGDGILFDSLRHAGGTNVVAYKPPNVTEVIQGDHFEISVEVASSRIGMTRLAA